MLLVGCKCIVSLFFLIFLHLAFEQLRFTGYKPNPNELFTAESLSTYLQSKAAHSTSLHGKKTVFYLVSCRLYTLVTQRFCALVLS